MKVEIRIRCSDPQLLHPPRRRASPSARMKIETRTRCSNPQPLRRERPDQSQRREITKCLNAIRTADFATGTARALAKSTAETTKNFIFLWMGRRSDCDDKEGIDIGKC
jgi:hypothetical protein